MQAAQIAREQQQEQQREQQEKRYQSAMQKVREAFDLQQYTNAVTWADAALQIKPSDTNAMKLKTRAMSKIDDGEKNSKEGNALDEQLEVLMVNFNLRNHGTAHSQSARKAVVMGALGPDGATHYLKLVDELRVQLESKGMLDARREDNLKKLKEAIQNWE